MIRRIRSELMGIDPHCWYCGFPLARFPEDYEPLDDGSFVLMHSSGLRVAHLEHQTPKSKGGSNDRTNLVLSCSACNQDKGTLTLDQYRSKVGRAFYGERS